MGSNELGISIEDSDARGKETTTNYDEYPGGQPWATLTTNDTQKQFNILFWNRQVTKSNTLKTLRFEISLKNILIAKT